MISVDLIQHHLHQPLSMSEKHMLKLPTTTHLRKHWIRSICKELKLSSRRKPFSKEIPGADEPVNPSTAKCSTKLDVQGLIVKLKSSICYHRDIFKESFDRDTWCAIAGFFCSLWFSLTAAASHKTHIHQLDFIGAFLQATAIRLVNNALSCKFC
jgi:hypothetical protein